MNLYYFVLFSVLSFIPSLFWLFFYYYYSPRFTTPRRFLLILFFLGMLSAVVAALVEREVFQILPDFIVETFGKYFFGDSPYQVSDVFILFALMFLFVAPVEEFFKFSVIGLAVKKKPKYLNQIIDGIKFGVVVGLGFAVVENGIYFYQPIVEEQNLALLKLILLRLFVSTLAHSLYTGIMGYYFGLARFYKLYGRHFLIEGFFFAVFIHAIFNFFLLANLGAFSIAVLIIMLLLMFKWYQDRRNLEFYVASGLPEFVRPPFLTERAEFESILAKNKVTYEFIKRLNLCLFCLRRQDPKKDICSYCGKKLERKK